MKDKIIGNIYGTNDITKFKFNELNRDINKKHVNELANSIKETGAVLQPIVIDKDFNLLDGHHRLKAMQILYDAGVEIIIPYIIREDVDDVTALITMNANSRTYGSKDFIDLYAKAQDGQCRKLLEIADSVNESAVTLLSVISCGSDVGRNKERIKKDEPIDFEDWDVISDFYEFLETIKPFIHLTIKTKQMMFRIYQHDSFKTQLFVRNAKNKYIQINEKIRFSTQQGICKEQILQLYNVNNPKHKIKYHTDAEGKIIIQE